MRLCGAQQSPQANRVLLRAFHSVCDKIRTRDLLVRSQTLYPAELHIHSLTFAANDIISITSLPVNQICRTPENFFSPFCRFQNHALRLSVKWFKLTDMGAAHQAVGLSARRGIVCPPDSERRDSMLTVEGLIAVISLCVGCFSIGYEIGRNTQK